jgi:hypothetical protein
VARLLSLALLALLLLPAVVQADGDPASDVLVFDGRDYFLPYAPPTSAESKARLDAATAAAFKAGFPIKVAVISGPGDLGAVPQMSGKPQDYADFLSEEIQFGYKDTLLVVMPEGYGISGTHNAAVKASIASLPKPKSGDPSDLANAAADAVKAVAAAGGTTIDIAPAPVTTAQGTVQAKTDSNTIVYVVGGTVAVIVLLVGLLLWARRTPGEPQAP